MDPAEVKKLESSLVRYGEHFDLRVDDYLPAAEPLRTKAGKIAKRQPKLQRKTLNWWKAQCSLRGLKTTGQVEELQARLRSRDKAQDVVIEQRERATQRKIYDERDRLSKIHMEEYRREERARRDVAYRVATTDEQKATVDASRLLKELFPADSTPASTHVVIKTSNYWVIEQACERLGLVYASAEAPPSASPRGQDEVLWSVVGKDGHAVRQAAETISRQAKTEREAAEAAREAAYERKLTNIRNNARARGEDRDISGEWEISCPELQDYSSFETEKASMSVYRDGQSSSGRFSATFHFSIIEGIMRISPLGKKNAKGERSTTYRWRGRETGEGEIQLGSDEKAFTMTFGQYGTKVAGRFRCEYLEEVSFTGIKVGEGSGRGVSAEGWEDFSEEAYDYACVHRWG